LYALAAMLAIMPRIFEAGVRGLHELRLRDAIIEVILISGPRCIPTRFIPCMYDRIEVSHHSPRVGV
jgi:hypothetical protein